MLVHDEGHDSRMIVPHVCENMIQTDMEEILEKEMSI